MKKRIKKIVNQFVLEEQDKKEKDKDIRTDLIIAKKVSKEEVERYKKDIKEILNQKDLLPKERINFEKSLQLLKKPDAWQSFYKKYKNAILRYHANKIKNNSRISYSENLQNTTQFLSSREKLDEIENPKNFIKFSHSSPPILFKKPSEYIKYLYEKNWTLFCLYLYLSNKPFYKKYKNNKEQKAQEVKELLNGIEAKRQQEGIDEDNINTKIETLKKTGNILFDKPVPFPFFPVSYTTFSRKYGVNKLCSWRIARKIIMGCKYREHIYILKKNPKLGIKYSIYCINEDEVDLLKLANYIKATRNRYKYNTSKNK